MRPYFEKYLDSLKGYQKNTYTVDPGVVAAVNEHWDLWFDAFGYERQGPKPAGPRARR